MSGFRFLVFCALTAVLASSAFAAPTGLWEAKDGGLIRIAPCGKALCGTVVKTVPAIDPDTGKPMKDKKNRDETKRDRPVVGIQTLIDMKPSAPGKWSGTLYNDDDGGTYAGHLLELGPKEIRIEGCTPIGVCGGDNLKRVK